MSKTKKRRKRRSFEDCVDYTLISDPTGGISMRSKGRKTGLGVRVYIWNLFTLNERDGTQKLTNAMISHNVREEFPDRHRLLAGMDSGRQSVNWWRHLYNKGVLLKPKGKPSRISLRYNDRGKVVDTRTGLVEIDHDAIAELCEKYEINDDRYAY